MARGDGWLTSHDPQTQNSLKTMVSFKIWVSWMESRNQFSWIIECVWSPAFETVFVLGSSNTPPWILWPTAKPSNAAKWRYIWVCLRKSHRLAEEISSNHVLIPSAGSNNWMNRYWLAIMHRMSSNIESYIPKHVYRILPHIYFLNIKLNHPNDVFSTIILCSSSWTWVRLLSSESCTSQTGEPNVKGKLVYKWKI